MSCHVVSSNVIHKALVKGNYLRQPGFSAPVATKSSTTDPCEPAAQSLCSKLHMAKSSRTNPDQARWCKNMCRLIQPGKATRDFSWPHSFPTVQSESWWQHYRLLSKRRLLKLRPWHLGSDSQAQSRRKRHIRRHAHAMKTQKLTVKFAVSAYDDWMCNCRKLEDVAGFA